MPNGPNPLTAPFSTLKQIGEQANVAIQSLGTGMARAASQGFDALASGAPPLPGVPGAAGAPQLPSPQALMPANLQATLSQIENVVIPAGLPRPSQMAGQPAFQPPAQPPAAPAPPPGGQAITGRRRITSLGGY